MAKTDEKFGKGVKFERIRRITGYLVGSMDKWNTAKEWNNVKELNIHLIVS